MNLDLILKFIEERENLNPYQRRRGPHFTDIFEHGSSCIWLPGDGVWGIKLFHSEWKPTGLHEVWTAEGNWKVQTAIHKLGYAPETGPCIALKVLGVTYNGFWTRVAQPISEERFEKEAQIHEWHLRQVGMADWGAKNCGLIDDHIVIIDFNITAHVGRYLE